MHGSSMYWWSCIFCHHDTVDAAKKDLVGVQNSLAHGSVFCFWVKIIAHMHLKHRQKQHLRVSNCQYHPSKYACIMFTKVSHWQRIGKPCSVPVHEYCTRCWFLYVKGFECTSPLVSKLLSSTFCCMKIDIDFTAIRPSVRWCDVVTFCTSHLLNKILKRS